MNTPHIPVLLDQVLTGLQVEQLPAGLFIDGTLGAAGHASAILKLAPESRLIGFDRDPNALQIAHERLGEF